MVADELFLQGLLPRLQVCVAIPLQPQVQVLLFLSELFAGRLPSHIKIALS